MCDNKLVADGQKRMQGDESYKRQVVDIRNAIQQKYMAKRENANLFRRWVLNIKMRIEIKNEVKKLAPDDALYLIRPA